jgi:hypothetical protein
MENEKREIEKRKQLERPPGLYIHVVGVVVGQNIDRLSTLLLILFGMFLLSVALAGFLILVFLFSV